MQRCKAESRRELTGDWGEEDGEDAKKQIWAVTHCDTGDNRYTERVWCERNDNIRNVEEVTSGSRKTQVKKSVWWMPGAYTPSGAALEDGGECSVRRMQLTPLAAPPGSLCYMAD
jgi:hypothetical protein